MKNHKNKMIAAVAVLIVLMFAFWYGGDAPVLQEDVPVLKTNQKNTGLNQTDFDESKLSDKSVSQNKEFLDASKSDASPVISNKNTQSGQKSSASSRGQKDKDNYNTKPVAEVAPCEPEDAVITNKEFTCTLSVSCDTILNNLSFLNNEKINIVPRDGVIFAEKTVSFYEGESVFNLLVREMKQNSVHMEFENTPIYNSAYIEGIANLYEFDCGELSGWMYKVNGWFPNYGCSRYKLKAGDKVEWVYTCNLGRDVGGHYSAKNGN